MKDFLKDYGGHLLGFLALLQVWVIALWKRFLQKGSVEVYPAAAIELGYGDFGPSVSLIGTVRAHSRGVFIDKMTIRIVRVRDRAEHEFIWRAFRPNSIPIGAGSGLSIAFATSFLLMPDNPREYNVFFASLSFATDYAPQVAPLQAAWVRFIQSKLGPINDPQGAQVAAILRDPNLSGIFFDDFVTQPEPGKLIQSLTQDLFWRVGQYELGLVIHCAHPARDLRRSWKFSVGERDEEVLRLNVITLIRQLCSLPTNYTYVYKEYT